MKSSSTTQSTEIHKLALVLLPSSLVRCAHINLRVVRPEGLGRSRVEGGESYQGATMDSGGTGVKGSAGQVHPAKGIQSQGKPV